MMKRTLALLCTLSLVLCLAACGSSTSVDSGAAAASASTASADSAPAENAAPAEEAPQAEEAAPAEEPEPAEPEKTEFSLGETWSVDGLFSVTVTGVTETDYRNQYSDKTPAAVYIIDYYYTNDGYDDGIMDGLYINMDDMIVDAAGMMGYSYPATVPYGPKETPVGAICRAQTAIGVDNPGPFKVTLNEYDSDYNPHSASFTLDPEAAPANVAFPARSVNDIPADYKIGETWSVDGQWDLTITGVTATDERNQYADTNPGAVYVVDYQYSNKGYDDDIMDGLYISIDSIIVDNAGVMGYSYPNTVTDYPQETPVDATCKAQGVVGVDHPGSFLIVISMYDSNDQKQTASFLLDVASLVSAPMPEADADNSSVDQTESEPFGMSNLEIIANALNDTLKSYYGDNTNVKYGTDKEGAPVIDAKFWEKGSTMNAVFAKTDFQDYKSKWDDMVSTLDSFSDVAMEMMDENGLSDGHLYLQYLNDSNTESTLLTIKDGEVIYDFVNDIGTSQ